VSELNHEIDRDNLDKEFVETGKEMARLLFPNGRKRYIEELDEKISVFGMDTGGGIDRSNGSFWNAGGGTWSAKKP
jgi:hypothetical protein